MVTKRAATCISPGATFQYGVHKPAYRVTNLREHTVREVLGRVFTDAQEETKLLYNDVNYPADEVHVENAHWIFEIPNAFSFRGRTFIDKEWADFSAAHPERISLAGPGAVSLSKTLEQEGVDLSLFEKLPVPVHLALATSSTDAAELVRLAHISCEILMSGDSPSGLVYRGEEGRPPRPVIHNHELFEAVANNPHLPESYRIVMVIRPGAQGASEIVGDYRKGDETHVYEYLRRNSYIPGGHYAANMADDAVRYSIAELGPADMKGLRHLYYQRTFVRLARKLGIEPVPERKRLTEADLEALRVRILTELEKGDYSPATLWGWNFGFDFAPSLYRLHASHQQVHQQYAIVPETMQRYEAGCTESSGQLRPYSLGDLVSDCIDSYRETHGSHFFKDYLTALHDNRRMDGRDDLESSLIIWQDAKAMLFVPKAQTSQWELQLMTLPDHDGNFAGNIIECDLDTRRSLDSGILKAQKVLAGLGARMVTSIEYSKRMNTGKEMDQPLLYAFLPRLPESPGAFSEAQLRFINGHYPEDFAAACRKQL
jgi:hypothetical protein